jgi:hypothetical protein
MACDAKDENDPYSRWQGFRINQLSLCISLFLTFAVATLGFSINLIIQPNYSIPTCFPKVFFFFSLLFGLLSVLLGSIACLTRLEDFRMTAKVVRYRSDQDKKAEVNSWRDDYKRLGRWTWRLFIGQLVTFGLQVVGLVLSLGITHWHQLTG